MSSESVYLKFPYEKGEFRVNDLADPERNIIQITDQYLECVDKDYEAKGFMNSHMSFLFITMIILYIIAIVTMRDDTPTFAIVGLTIFTLIFCAVTSYGMRDLFAYTHYPILLFRKTKEVFIFKSKTEILKCNWDDLLILKERENGVFGRWCIKAYIVKNYVKGATTFISLGSFSLPGAHPYHLVLNTYWNFINSYMLVDNIKPLEKTVLSLAPVNNKKETYAQGLSQLIYSDCKYTSFIGKIIIPIFVPLSLFHSIFRFFCMQTSRIPVWPDEIKEKMSKGKMYTPKWDNDNKFLWRESLGFLTKEELLEITEQKIATSEQIYNYTKRTRENTLL